ncbi:PKD domain-containing protein [Algoriphagus alkaliphilus]|uniref:PKD domain-containing protein n=1 Tax=Algoriphagus alkaliphilus TaxID=279824 RepID=A0A1G5VCQ9_9BACT|nr:PKD domain-containing protein [Algoriphagus alkaliphilus]SDA43652.1 PKD domain-containing protein [Algoriphagus alkaliphilus]
MKHKERLMIFFLCISFLVSFRANAQLSTLGREFYVGFMENNKTSTAPDQALISITANEDATGTLTYGGNLIPFALTKGKVFTHAIPSQTYDLLHRNSEVIESKSLKISSSGDIAVHAFNLRTNSADGTVVLPITSLGKEYFVTAHYNPKSNTSSDLESTLLVVAIEDDTRVEVTPTTSTVKGNPAGNPLIFTLNAGQTYQVKSEGDLTGTRVRVINGTDGDCKNVAVFGGNKMTYGGSCGLSGDHLFQQAFPVFTWGKSFTHIPLLGRTSGEIVKVLASENGTEVIVNGQSKGIINQGNFLQMEFAKDEVAIIDTSKPTAVSVIAKSMECNEASNDLFGDPFLLTYNPNNQKIEQTIFNSLSGTGFINHFVNILLKTSSISATRLNNKQIDSEFKPVPGNPQLSFARIKLAAGPNSISNPDGFIAYAYGSGLRSSYGFSAGANLESTKFEAASNYDFEVIGDQVACMNQEGIWSINPENENYTLFTWNFGDGSASVNGQEVAHTFKSEGKFQVKVLASSGSASCGVERNFVFEVEVKKVSVDLIGPESTCSALATTYTLENSSNFDRIILEAVEGGEIVSQTEKSITILWQEASEEGKIVAIPVAENGCLGDAIVKTVKLGVAQSEDSPIGPTQVCGPILSEVNYEVPNASSQKKYEWSIVGGEIKSGQNTSKVEVLWGINSPEFSIFYTETPLENTTEACPKISKTLVVDKIEPLKINTINTTAPNCPGEGGGSIVIKVSGGSGELDIIWSHVPDSNSGTADNLKAGLYKVTVKDRSGCGILVQEIELKEPENLRLIGEPEYFPITCSGASDGGFMVKVLGGFPPYSVEGIESAWDGDFLTVSGLAQGKFSLYLVDAKGCSLPVGGEIKGVQPLALNFVQESPRCPGGNNGSLSVVVTGGVPPYKYSWAESGVSVASFTGRSTSNSSAVLRAIPSGEYTVTVTDFNGCSLVSYGIVEEVKPQVRMPTGFKPQDGSFKPVSNCYLDFRMQVFNKWGQVVYWGTEGWDGMLKGKEAPVGTYSYRVIYQFPVNGEFQVEEIHGGFALIR